MGISKFAKVDPFKVEST